MIQTATGIILRTHPLTETSLIVHWLTPDFGRLATAAKGARRPKSPFLGRLDLFYEGDFSFARSRRSDLHALREVHLRETNRVLRGDLRRLRCAAYAAAFIGQATETETPLPAVFEMLRGFLRCLREGPASPPLVFAFELKLLQELGLQPEPSQTKLTAGAKRILQALSANEWQSCLHLKLLRSQTAELAQFLRAYLTFHLGRLPAGRDEALAERI